MTNETRIALATGGNKGIGLEISRNLSGAGCTVPLSARNVERGHPWMLSLLLIEIL
jgi:NAD(P)-dependent dehydrogenase (short-subunit alcohol dehydrogenase family)